MLARLKGIQRATQDNGNRFLYRLEKQLEQELQDVLDKEELIWFQKARTVWMNDGDRNTSYYHTKTAIQRRKNRVSMLKDNDNRWIEDEQEVGTMVNHFFRSLFSEELVDRPWLDTAQLWPRLEEDTWEAIAGDMSKEEIMAAMFSIGGLKAPGGDGFSAIFFHRNWDVVGDTLIKSIQEMWLNPAKVAEVNKTLVTLIPKVECPEKVSQLRPIFSLM